MFVNTQHPGESPSDRSDPADPSKFSTWPSGVKGARPRSAMVVGFAEACGDQYHLLREYAMDHPEVGAILAACD